MTNRITDSMRDNKLKYLNKMLEEIGSELRFGAEYPWSKYFLAIKAKDRVGCWDRTLNACGNREIFETVGDMMTLIYELQKEGLLRKKEIIEKWQNCLSQKYKNV